MALELARANAGEPSAPTRRNVIRARKRRPKIPCDAVRTCTVSLDVADIDTLKIGLDHAGYQYRVIGSIMQIYGIDGRLVGTINTNSKQITYQGDLDEEELLTKSNEIKRLYSRGCVVSQAKKHRWPLTEKKPGQFVVQRRTV